MLRILYIFGCVTTYEQCVPLGSHGKSYQLTPRFPARDRHVYFRYGGKREGKRWFPTISWWRLLLITLTKQDNSMGSVMSNMYGGVQYMLNRGGEKQALNGGGSLKTATPFVRTRSRWYISSLHPLLVLVNQFSILVIVLIHLRQIIVLRDF